VLWQWRRAEHNVALQARERQRADAALAQLEIQRAEDLFAADRVPVALAYLAGVVRLDPSNRVAAERLMSALGHRNLRYPSCRHSNTPRKCVAPCSVRMAGAWPPPAATQRARVGRGHRQPVTPWLKHKAR